MIETMQQKTQIPDAPQNVFRDIYAMTDALVAEVEKVVIGKTHEIVMLVTALLAGGHVLIEDVPGVGKTTLAAALAAACGLKFKRAQFTPDVMASDITGFHIYNRQTESFEFREGLVMTNILLADEINRASPKTQSSLLESMEEANVTVDGTTFHIPEPFFVIATENPTGFVGTYPLPEAQLDRFTVKISIGYPTAEEEINIIRTRKHENPIDHVKAVTDAEKIIQLKNAAADVYVDDAIYDYIVRLIGATRRHSALALGASPRASLALSKMAQAYALMHKRDYVIPEDVSAIFVNTVAHRIMLRQEAKLQRMTPETILREILRAAEVPFIGTRTSDASSAETQKERGADTDSGEGKDRT